jgi:major membrane immunogen (membrane-anchored lipoprotein)
MTDEEGNKDYMEIKMSGGWFMTITKATSERFDNEYVEIAKERSNQKKARFNLNPKYTRKLGEALIKFADANDL